MSNVIGEQLIDEWVKRQEIQEALEREQAAVQPAGYLAMEGAGVVL